MIEAFSDYGFPQSHAQSMAGIIYASAWIKHHYPAALLAGIMANLPMGFYDSQTLIQDAKRRGITVHGVDIQASGVHAILVPDPDSPVGQPAIRRGLTSVTGLSMDTARTIIAARTEQPFQNLEDIARRTRLPARLMEHLAAAGAFDSFGDHRRTTLWTAGAFPRSHQPCLPGLGALAPAPDLPAMTPAEQTAADLATTGASATTHPIEHVRAYLERQGALPAAAVRALADQTRVRLGGLAKYLQRPPTANGVAFGALEDETGMINLVFSPPCVGAPPAPAARGPGRPAGRPYRAITWRLQRHRAPGGSRRTSGIRPASPQAMNVRDLLPRRRAPCRSRCTSPRRPRSCRRGEPVRSHIPDLGSEVRNRRPAGMRGYPARVRLVPCPSAA
ncbi:hypothetical protein [Streptomyces yerevanensis]|uniref:helix-hairpin-helix domain-containing protein n=1 Tax=Streptomyces yerevanensis TaxID=66378 RepID=UPI0005275BCC|nr:hypothetical protein [Streptomyces yerevanensis]